MTEHFLPDYGLYLLNRGVRPATRLAFFELPIDHLTRPALRTVSVALSTEEGGRATTMRCWEMKHVESQ